MKQKISEADWVNLVTGASDIHGAVTVFTSIFLKIAIPNICRNIISHKIYVQITQTYNIAILVESSF
jgi:hypothetical protein